MLLPHPTLCVPPTLTPHLTHFGLILAKVSFCLLNTKALPETLLIAFSRPLDTCDMDSRLLSQPQTPVTCGDLRWALTVLGLEIYNGWDQTLIKETVQMNPILKSLAENSSKQ